MTIVVFYDEKHCTRCQSDLSVIRGLFEGMDPDTVVYHDVTTVDGRAEAAFWGVYEFPAMLIFHGDSEAAEPEETYLGESVLKKAQEIYDGR